MISGIKDFKRHSRKKKKNMRMGDKEEPTQISEWAEEQKHANISTL